MIGKIFSTVSNALDFNAATLSGCMDIIIVDQDDDTMKSSPFHVRFGKSKLLRSREKNVIVRVNGEIVPEIQMRLGSAGAAYFLEEVEDTRDVLEEGLLASPIASPVLTPTHSPRRFGTDGSRELPSPMNLEDELDTVDTKNAIVPELPIVDSKDDLDSGDLASGDLASGSPDDLLSNDLQSKGDTSIYNSKDGRDEPDENVSKEVEKDTSNAVDHAVKTETSDAKNAQGDPKSEDKAVRDTPAREDRTPSPSRSRVRKPETIVCENGKSKDLQRSTSLGEHSVGDSIVEDITSPNATTRSNVVATPSNVKWNWEWGSLPEKNKTKSKRTKDTATVTEGLPAKDTSNISKDSEGHTFHELPSKEPSKDSGLNREAWDFADRQKEFTTSLVKSSSSQANAGEKHVHIADNDSTTPEHTMDPKKTRDASAIANFDKTKQDDSIGGDITIQIDEDGIAGDDELEQTGKSTEVSQVRQK